MKGPPHRSDRPRDLLAGPLGNGYLPATEPGRHHRGLRRAALLRVALTLVQRFFKVLALELQNSDLLSRELALLLKLPGLDLDQFRLLPDQRLAVLHFGLERGQLLRLLPECSPGVPRGDACADQQTPGRGITPGNRLWSISSRSTSMGTPAPACHAAQPTFLTGRRQYR